MSGASAGERSPVQLDQQSVGRLSRMDAMQVQAMAVETERRRRLRIAALEAALARIDEGEFGYCARCDEPISEGRLEITRPRYCAWPARAAARPDGTVPEMADRAARGGR